MPRYDFHYFIASSDVPVADWALLKTDGEARARAAAELLRLPGRLGADVWSAGRLVYSHRRPPRPAFDSVDLESRAVMARPDPTVPEPEPSPA